MKNTIIIFLFATILFACSGSDDNNNSNNPFLTPPPVNINLSLSLPEYNPLNFDGNSIILSGQGIRGIVVSRISSSFYTAYDITDPNHIPNSCSRMEVEGIIATCQCEDANKYDVITGQKLNDQSQYPMLQYRVEKNGGVIHVFN